MIVTHSDPQYLAQLEQEARQALTSGGFSLREWASNSPICLQNCPDAKLSTEPIIKVLGYFYNLADDTLQLKLTSLDSHVPAKRAILSQISSIFDPLGFFNQFFLLDANYYYGNYI